MWPPQTLNCICVTCAATSEEVVGCQPSELPQPALELASQEDALQSSLSPKPTEGHWSLAYSRHGPATWLCCDLVGLVGLPIQI